MVRLSLRSNGAVPELMQAIPELMQAVPELHGLIMHHKSIGVVA